MRDFVAVKPDVADLCRWHQSLDARDHAEARAENRNQGELSSGKHRSAAFFERRFDFHILERQVSERFEAFEHGDFFNQLAENIGTRFLVAQEGNLVLNQRMRKDGDVFCMFKILHGHFLSDVFKTVPLRISRRKAWRLR